MNSLQRSEANLQAWHDLTAMRITADAISEFEQHEAVAPDYFQSIGDIEAELIAAFDPQVKRNDPRLPFASSRDVFQMRSHELTIWFGIDGHGKSMLLSHVLIDLMANGQKCAMASLEMPLGKVAKRMARQAIGNDNPTAQAISAFCKWGLGKLWFYREPEGANTNRIYAAIRFAVKKLGVQHFVVDNLTCMLDRDEDMNEQKAVIKKLALLARDTGVHIHLVCHSRKVANEAEVPSRNDLKGSGAQLALADNVFIVWRNPVAADKRKPDCPCDAALVLGKQRHYDGAGDDTGFWGLWFDQRSQQFKDFASQPTRKYVMGIQPA